MSGARYRLTLAYDGTDFEGWQLQERAKPVRTVQGVLERALAELDAGERVSVTAAGRTDAGVHAIGQVVSFVLARDMDPALLQRALNGLLPRDLRVVEAACAPGDFDARRAATSKLYRYALDTGALQLPSRRRFAAHVPGPLDVAAMRSAAALYVGRHDFAAVRSAGSTVKTTVRTVTRSELRVEAVDVPGGTALVYEIEADGFLRKMVRSLVGGLVALGRGAASLDGLRRALESGDRQAWPAPAPACGLTLVRVYYPPSDERVLP